MGSRRSPRPNDGGWPTRDTSRAPPPRSDASGYPHVGQRRKSAHWAFRPKRTGHGKQSYAKPWNPKGTPNGHRTPRAFAQAGPAMRPSAPSLPPSGFGRNRRSNWISRKASIGSIIRHSWRKCRRPLGSADNCQPGSQRVFSTMAPLRPPPQGHPRAGAVHRCWR